MSLSRERVRVVLRTDRHRAPAKINLALHVTGRRPDGYHTLSSLVAFAAHGDFLSVQPAEADGFEIVGPFADELSASLPNGARNIVVAALDGARTIAGRHGCDIEPMRLVLEKHLPVASGIGGGSADAAALIRLLGNAAPGLRAALAEACVRLGADVPMCVDGRAARVSGIGEIIEPLPAFPRVAAVLVNPRVPVATPLVFARLDNRDNPPLPALPLIADRDDLLGVLRDSRNDLQAPAVALAPAIAAALAVLGEAGALFARMSGSGATVFGLFADGAAADRAAALVSAGHPDWWVQATSLGSAREAAS